MFVLLFTYVFGGAISGSITEYLTFALPGIIVMNMLFVTMHVGMGSTPTADAVRGLMVQGPVAEPVLWPLLWAVGLRYQRTSFQISGRGSSSAPISAKISTAALR